MQLNGIPLAAAQLGSRFYVIHKDLFEDVPAFTEWLTIENIVHWEEVSREFGTGHVLIEVKRGRPCESS